MKEFIRSMDNGDGETARGDVQYGAFSTPMMNSILKHFGAKAFARSSACMEFEAFLKRIKAGGKCCLEIGTYRGVTAAILSQYFDKVICTSVDLERDTYFKYDLVKYLGIQNIEFHDLADNSEKDALIQTLDFDFCYQDGDHTHDTTSDFKLVKRCGRVLLHEYWPIQPPVWNLVNSLPQDEITRAQFDCFAYWERKRG